MGSSTMGDPQSPKPLSWDLAGDTVFNSHCAEATSIHFFYQIISVAPQTPGSYGHLPLPGQCYSEHKQNWPPASSLRVGGQDQVPGHSACEQRLWCTGETGPDTAMLSSRERSKSYSTPSARSSGFRTCSDRGRGRRRRVLEEVASQGLQPPGAGGEGAGEPFPADTRHAVSTLLRPGAWVPEEQVAQSSAAPGIQPNHHGKAPGL